MKTTIGTPDDEEMCDSGGGEPSITASRRDTGKRRILKYQFRRRRIAGSRPGRFVLRARSRLDNWFLTPHSRLWSMIRGSREAWWEIVEQCYSWCVYNCRKYRLNDDDVHDIVSIVFDKLWDHRYKFEVRYRQGAFHKWLGTTTHRSVCDLYRAWKKNPRGYGIHVDYDPFANLACVEEIKEEDFRIPQFDVVERIMRILNDPEAVSPRNRDVFLRHKIYEEEAASVAESVNNDEKLTPPGKKRLTPGNVRVICARLLAEIRERLGKESLDD